MLYSNVHIINGSSEIYSACTHTVYWATTLNGITMNCNSIFSILLGFLWFITSLCHF